MRLPHRAGPGADHALGRNVALLQDEQRGDQFVAREVALVIVEGEGGERGDHALAALVGAVAGLDAPDRDDDFARHAESVLDRIEQAAQFADAADAVRQARLRHQRIEIVADRASVFRLLARQPRDFGVVGHVGQRAVEGVAGDAALLRERAQRFDIAAEGAGFGLGGLRGGGGGERRTRRAAAARQRSSPSIPAKRRGGWPRREAGGRVGASSRSTVRREMSEALPRRFAARRFARWASGPATASRADGEARSVLARSQDMRQ